MTRYSRRRVLTGAVAVAASVTVMASPSFMAGASASSGSAGRAAGSRPPVNAPEVVASFDPTALETPEGLAVAPDGTVFVSLAQARQIRAVRPDGSQRTVATVGDAGSLGPLALDRRGNLYAGLGSGNPATHGIWQIGSDGAARRLASLPVDSVPNGITFDRRGDLFVADTAKGLIYQLPRGAATVRVWLDDPALAPAPIAGLNFGPNGLQEFRGDLYVANSGQGTILRIPVDAATGAPGAPQVVTTNLPTDDFTLDVHGNVYATTDPFNTVVKVAPDGAQTVLLTREDGLDGPSAAKFGYSGRDRLNLYITNASFEFFAVPGQPRRPSLLRLRLPVLGYRPPLGR